MAQQKQAPAQYWEARLQKKYHITVKLTPEDANKFQRLQTKALVPPMLGMGLLGAILIAIYAPLNLSNIDGIVMFILSVIPGVIGGVPIGVIIFFAMEKGYMRKFQGTLAKRAEEAKARAAQEAQVQAIEEGKRRTAEEMRQHAAEEARMQKLQQIIKVSTKLAVERIAQVLELSVDETWKRVFDWAEKFQFTIDGDYILFNKDTLNDFIASMDKEFASWGSQGKV